MKKKSILSCIILIFLALALSGCLDIFNIDDSTVYVTHTTKISYKISYGYDIECSGSGKYEITYRCDIPDETINTNIVLTSVHDSSYSDELLATFNWIKYWEIISTVNKNYDLGITTSVISESYLVDSLDGDGALTIQEIKDFHPDLINRYCNAQSSEEVTYINPDNQDIAALAAGILADAGTDNSFLIAKDLFIWLKSHTSYIHHENSGNPQTASYTLEHKEGDCDDLSFLYISLCRALDIPARFIRGFQIEETIAISHAWTEVFVGGDLGFDGWIPVECAGVSDDPEVEVNQNFGVERAYHLRIFKDDGTDESLNVSLSGILYKKYSPDRNVEPTSKIIVSDYTILESKELIIDENLNRYYR